MVNFETVTSRVPHCSTVAAINRLGARGSPLSSKLQRVMAAEGSMLRSAPSAICPCGKRCHEDSFPCVPRVVVSNVARVIEHVTSRCHVRVPRSSESDVFDESYKSHSREVQGGQWSLKERSLRPRLLLAPMARKDHLV